jgi:hypothetical protein
MEQKHYLTNDEPLKNTALTKWDCLNPHLTRLQLTMSEYGPTSSIACHSDRWRENPDIETPPHLEHQEYLFRFIYEKKIPDNHIEWTNYPGSPTGIGEVFSEQGLYEDLSTDILNVNINWRQAPQYGN